MRTTSYVEAVLDPVRVGVPLQAIERVVRAVAVQAVPGAPGCLLGAIEVAGEWISVYDTRTLLGLPSRPLRASDRIVLTRERCGLLVDEVLGTVEAPPVELADRVALQAAGVRGVARGGGGLLLVQDLRRLLALQRAIPIHADA
jgi:purine-binding chemotaxis protein CheW